MAASETSTAELHLGDSLRLAPIAHARMVGSQGFVLAYQVIGAVLGLFIGMLLQGFVPLAFIWGGYLVPTWLPIQALIVICGIIGWSTGLRLAQKRHQARFLAGIRRRGTPDSVQASYRIEDAGWRLTTPRIDYLIAWDAILEIVPAPEDWLVQVDTITYFLPKRAFANAGAEKAFLGDMLQRVRPEVRERSREAAAFAGA